MDTDRPNARSPRCEAGSNPGQPIHIGHPVSGMTAWVIDDSLTIQPPGSVGELALGGVGLARGYWKRPELTAETFVIHPEIGRIYRTGDLVHRDEQGRFFCQGRVDSQVKIRGHRVELGEIETRLTAHPGVFAAACRLQSDEQNAALVGFIVPADPDEVPTPASLRSWLESALPSYMVPARFGVLDQLPTSVGGKLDRSALPWLDAEALSVSAGESLAPRNAIEKKLAAAVGRVLPVGTSVSVLDDFFNDLGGDSLAAAEYVTILRQDEATAWATVRDVYEARTIAALAERCRAGGEPCPSRRDDSDAAQGHPLGVTVLQTLWLAAMFWIGSAVSYLIAFEFFPRWVSRAGVPSLMIAAPLLIVLARWLTLPVSVVVAVLVKRLLIGTYRPRRSPVWSGFYLRHWIVRQAARWIPWGTLEGTTYRLTVLRFLGARIGERVDIDRGVDLSQGGWDLLEIGDDVTIGRDASVRVVELDDGDVVIAPVRLGAGSVLETRSGVGGSCLGRPPRLPHGAVIAGLLGFDSRR